MKRIRRFLSVSALAVLLALVFLLFPSVKATSGDSSLVQVLEASTLEIQLGPEWAGVLFQLKTDYGMYPGTIPVGQDGILRMEIGGSSKYQLSCFVPGNDIPNPDEVTPVETVAEETTAPTTAPAETTEPTTVPTTAATEGPIYVEVQPTEAPAEVKQGNTPLIIALLVIESALILGLIAANVTLNTRNRKLENQLRYNNSQSDLGVDNI